MQDPANPTFASGRPIPLCPPEDWDLTVTGIGFEGLFLELVEDRQCPKADFFLHCLYLWVYQTVRGQAQDTERERLLRRGEVSSEPALRQWARHSRALIADPRRADRHLWWGFGQKRGKRSQS
jgi:hypothetical protein